MDMLGIKDSGLSIIVIGIIVYLGYISASRRRPYRCK